MTTPSWLPPVLQQVADVAGVETALTLAQEYGGRRVDIPKRTSARNWLVKAVGADAASKIIDHFGPGRLDIPLGHFGSFAQLRRRINRRYEELEQLNASASAIALDLGIGERAVRKRRAKRRAHDGETVDPSQKSLF